MIRIKTRLDEQNVLFFLRATEAGGTENVVLQLCKIFTPLVNKIVVISADGFPKYGLEYCRFRHYVIPDIEVRTAKNIVAIISTLKKIITEENITLIHTHHRMAAFYIEFLGLYRKCRIIHTCHNTYYDKKELTRFSYRHANLISCGEMVKKNLTDFFRIPSDRVTVIHNAVSPFKGMSDFDPLIQRLKAEGNFIIANIGRLSKEKGFSYYIEAIAFVLARHPETRFLIIGSGEDERKLKNMAKSLEGRLFFMGYRFDARDIMRQADLIVLSSLWEGFPLVPIEAFSVGKTIVATAVDGTVEIVHDYRTGLLVKPKNAEELAEKIIWMIDHPDERKRMEKEAEEEFKTNFSIEYFREKYIKYYRKIVDNV